MTARQKHKPLPMWLAVPVVAVGVPVALGILLLSDIVEGTIRAFTRCLGPGIQADEDARVVQELEVMLARVDAGDSDLPG